MMTKEPLRILAPNPSPLTGPGTNSFLIGRDQVAVIDPGPDDPGHLRAIAEAAKGRVSHIFVTHSHLDHSAGAASLARITDARIYGFGPADAGRSPQMQQLATTGLVGGGEGLDSGFMPDIRLTDGQMIVTAEWTLQAHFTPGHFGNHMCFQFGSNLLCGDIIMGWSSTLISPPDGDLLDYFRSLNKISLLSPEKLFPAHGDPVDDPAGRIAELAAHRRKRTAEIVTALQSGPANAEGLARRIYDVAPHLLPAAQRNVLAHLLALAELGAVSFDGPLAADSLFSMA